MTALCAPLRLREGAAGTLLQSRSGALLAASLLVTLALAPLPLGCVREGERALLAALLLGVAALACARTALLGRALPLPAGSLALVGLAGLAFLQLLPIALAPGTRAAAVLGDVVPRTLTVLPVRTEARACELLALVALYIGASVLLARRGRALAACMLLLALCTASSVYGFLMQQGVLPPVDAGQTRTVMVATYFNRNHFAGLLVMGILAGTGALLAQRARGASAARQVLLVAALGACVAALLGTESRGGLAALAAGTLVFCGLVPGGRRPAVLLGLVGAAMLLAVVVPDSLLGRLQEVPAELKGNGTRPDIWRAAFSLWQAFPWTGSGLGTYGDLSPATQPPGIGGRLEHAHCDPLELLVEIGIVGLSLAAAAFVCFGVRAVRARACGGDGERSCLAAGAVAAVAATACHSLFDFNLHIPANAAWCALLCGMATGLHCGAAIQLRGRSIVAVAGVLLAVAALSVRRAAVHEHDDGEAQVAAASERIGTEPQQATALLQEARLCNPFSPRANRLLGEVLLRARDPAAGAALAAGLRWLNPDDRPAHQLEVGILCVAAGDVAAAQRWLHPLFAASPPRLETLLGKLYEAVPVSELLAVLLPPEPREVREALAVLLLRHGEFAGRERELAALRGDAAPALLTVADGVLLRECTIEPGREGACLTQAVTLSFELAVGAQAPPLALRCETSGAAVFRPFTPETEPFRYTIRLDPTFPPGEYAISLSFRGDAPFLPLGRASIEGTELELTADGVHGAETCLYWETADPGRRLRPRTGVPLRPGDCLWRDVVLPASATTLVLRTGAPVQPAVYLGEQELRCLSARASLVHRFALPAARVGRLSIQGGAGEVLVQDFFVAGRREQ